MGLARVLKHFQPCDERFDFKLIRCVRIIWAEVIGEVRITRVPTHIDIGWKEALAVRALSRTITKPCDHVGNVVERQGRISRCDAADEVLSLPNSRMR